jgi:hypothetical protein
MTCNKIFGHANFTDQELMQLAADIRAGSTEPPWQLIQKTKQRLHYLKNKKPLTSEDIAITLDSFIKNVQELLGHSSISVTADIYTHVIERVKRKAISKLDNIIQIEV